MADKGKSEATEVTEVSGPKKKSSMLLIIIIITAAFIVGGGGAVAFLLMQDKGGKPAGEAAQDVADTKTGDEQKMGPVIKIDPSFIINLVGSSGHSYLKLDIGLELSAPELDEEVNLKMPKIRDAVLMILSTKTFDDVKTSQGKMLLKEELLLRINSFLAMGKIKHIYFTSFVVQ